VRGPGQWSARPSASRSLTLRTPKITNLSDVSGRRRGGRGRAASTRAHIALNNTARPRHAPAGQPARRTERAPRSPAGARRTRGPRARRQRGNTRDRRAAGLAELQYAESFTQHPTVGWSTAQVQDFPIYSTKSFLDPSPRLPCKTRAYPRPRRRRAVRPGVWRSRSNGPSRRPPTAKGAQV
jgi:hypothetical protein